jgi:hypothetical protein
MGLSSLWASDDFGCSNVLLGGLGLGQSLGGVGGEEVFLVFGFGGEAVGKFGEFQGAFVHTHLFSSESDM